MILEPKSQNGLQNDQKALGFSLKATWRFAMSNNLMKPVENGEFGDTYGEDFHHLASLGWRTQLFYSAAEFN